MANNNKGSVGNPAPKPGTAPAKIGMASREVSAGTNIINWVNTNPYAPGLLLFLFSFIIGLIIYKDYGIAWDEPFQRGPGLLSYDYIFNDNEDLFQKTNDHHGAGFELFLVVIEKCLNIIDSKAIYEMRHLVSHVVFLIGALAGYILAYRLFKNKFIASLGFMLLVFAPRLYAHSFFNSKDIPFLSMFLITLAICQLAFEKNRKWLFLLLGLTCGYATSIRIIGIMPAGFIGLFMAIDMAIAYRAKNKQAKKAAVKLLLFCAGFCFTVYTAWPYLWKDPVYNFMESFTKLSHFNLWTGVMLLSGKYITSLNLPSAYFPIWFLITNPILWLLMGFAGFVWAGIAFIREPKHFLKNTPERNFLLYLLCFASPIAAVIFMHSVIYDDWRHLYFVYPSFVMLALYFIHKIYTEKHKFIIAGVCMVQVLLTGVFMVKSHPFQQVYFNELVSHDKEFLRKNYELEYWGCSYKNALDHLVKTNPTGPIKVYSSLPQFIGNNMLILPEQDRGRIQIVYRDQADYIITNFRSHTYDYPLADIDYSIKVLNSTILCVYRQDADTIKRKQKLELEINAINRSLAANPNDYLLQSTVGDAYLFNSQYDSATAHYLHVLDLRPDYLAITDVAGEYYMRKRYADAIALCKKTIQVAPGDVNSRVNAALCFMRLAQFDSAVAYLQKAAQIDPDANGVYPNLAYSYKALGKPDSAQKYEAIAQQTTPGFRLKN